MRVLWLCITGYIFPYLSLSRTYPPEVAYMETNISFINNVQSYWWLDRRSVDGRIIINGRHREGLKLILKG